MLVSVVSTSSSSSRWPRLSRHHPVRVLNSGPSGSARLRKVNPPPVRRLSFSPAKGWGSTTRWTPHPPSNLGRSKLNDYTSFTGLWSLFGISPGTSSSSPARPPSDGEPALVGEQACRDLRLQPTLVEGAEQFTSTEVVYGVADPDVTVLPEYGVSP